MANKNVALHSEKRHALKGIVRRRKSHRIGFSLGCILILLAAVVCMPIMGVPVGVLLAAPVLVVLGPMTLYYLTWQIRFEKKEIVRSVCFRKTRRYPYTMLRNVTKGFYFSEKDMMIHMDFADGRTLRFRMRDENAACAERELKRHCSIKTF